MGSGELPEKKLIETTSVNPGTAVLPYWMALGQCRMVFPVRQSSLIGRW
jgi:hypothetical protein